MLTLPRIRYSIIAIAFIIGLLWRLESPIEPQSFSYPASPPELKGPLAVNTKLQNAKRLFENKIFAPESFTADKEGNIYTGAGDGMIYKIKDDKLTPVVRTGEDNPHCGIPELEYKCGRPNSLRLDADGNLIIADAYKGLLKVLLPSHEIQVLHASSDGIQGVPFKFLNGLEISKDGIIYFTDSSSKWNRKDNRLEVLEMNNMGRLLMYNPKTKSTHLLYEGLYFPNGIALTSDESALLVNELSASRVIKFFLKGPKKGNAIVIQNNLPGYPDNIRRNSKGNYYVGMSHTRFATWNPLHKFLDLLGPYPGLRKIIAKVGNDFFYNLCLPKNAIIVEMDEEGKILDSLQDPTGKVIETVTDAFDYKGKLYIGSFSAKFVGQMDLS